MPLVTKGLVKTEPHMLQIVSEIFHDLVDRRIVLCCVKRDISHPLVAKEFQRAPVQVAIDAFARELWPIELGERVTLKPG